jgi:hypothetical protein
VPGFMGVVFGARDGITDLPRTSFGADMRCPPSEPRCVECLRKCGSISILHRQLLSFIDASLSCDAGLGIAVFEPLLSPGRSIEPAAFFAVIELCDGTQMSSLKTSDRWVSISAIVEVSEPLRLINALKPDYRVCEYSSIASITSPRPCSWLVLVLFALALIAVFFSRQLSRRAYLGHAKLTGLRQ